MPLPYDHYIRFLITKGLHDVTDVNEDLKRLGLLPIQQDCFTEHYRTVTNTVPKGILAQIDNKSYGSDFLKWMRVLEVEGLWYLESKYKEDTKKAAAAKLAYDIHSDPAMRLSINALMVKAVAVPDIAQTINARYSAMLSEAAISVYTHFFFNPRRMTRADWKTYLRWVPASEAKVFYTALTDTLDVLKTELDLPAKVNVCDAVQFLLTKSYQKAKTYLNVNTREGNNEAREWIDAVIKLSDKYEKYRSTDRDDFSKVLQLEFEYVDTQFGSPDDETMKEVRTKGEGENKNKDGNTSDHPAAKKEQ